MSCVCVFSFSVCRIYLFFFPLYCIIYIYIFFLFFIFNLILFSLAAIIRYQKLIDTLMRCYQGFHFYLFFLIFLRL